MSNMVKLTTDKKEALNWSILMQITKITNKNFNFISEW